jgi:hypothetical protein
MASDRPASWALSGERVSARGALRSLAPPEEVEHWSLTTRAREGGEDRPRIVRHGRYVVFQLAEVAVPRALFAEILGRIERLRPRPPPFSA